MAGCSSLHMAKKKDQNSWISDLQGNLKTFQTDFPVIVCSAFLVF